MGFVMDFNGKHAKIKHVGQKHFVRFDSLGPGYSPEEIIDRIVMKDSTYYAPELRVPTDDPKKCFPEGWKPGNIDILTVPTVYEMYRELMDISFHRTVYNRWLNSFVGGDLPYYENHIENYQVVVKYGIKTTADIEHMTEELLQKLKAMEEQKRLAVNAIRRAQYHGDIPNVNKSMYERDNATRFIKIYRNDLHYLGRVAAQFPELQRKLKLIEQRVYPEYYKAKAMADAKEAARYKSGYYDRDKTR